MARAVYANSDVTLNLTGRVCREPRGYDLRDGRRAATQVERHADDRVQAFVELKRERESHRVSIACA